MLARPDSRRKGWEYRERLIKSDAVERGAAPKTVRKLYELGWLTYLEVVTDDCYGTLIVEYRGSDGELHISRAFPEFYAAFGAVVQDPSGWCELYLRPNPASTEGMYVVIAFSGGFQGTALPFIPPTTLKLYLPNESTQESAYIEGVAGGIGITDQKRFTESLREVLSTSETNTLLRELLEEQKKEHERWLKLLPRGLKALERMGV